MNKIKKCLDSYLMIVRTDNKIDQYHWERNKNVVIIFNGILGSPKSGK